MNQGAAMQKVVDHLAEELTTLRTGRANPALVSELMVESYGAIVPLKQIAQIATTDAHTLTITPWDPGNVASIEQAITQSDLGLQPTTEGTNVRLRLPPMTEERRLEMTKVVGEKLEASRVALRNVRHETITEVEKEDLPLDALKGRKETITKQTQEHNEMLEKLAEQKKQELLTV